MIRIRRAEADRDAEPISRLIGLCDGERVTLLDALTPEEEAAYLRSLGPRDAVFVAHDDGGFAGFQSCSAYGSYSSKLRHVAEVGSWVMPEFRGRGIGRRLWYEATLPFLREKGFSRAWNTVIEYNTPAIMFYRSLGFTICGRFTGHVRFPDRPNEPVDEVIMELNF